MQAFFRYFLLTLIVTTLVGCSATSNSTEVESEAELKIMTSAMKVSATATDWEASDEAFDGSMSLAEYELEIPTFTTDVNHEGSGVYIEVGIARFNYLDYPEIVSVPKKFKFVILRKNIESGVVRKLKWAWAYDHDTMAEVGAYVSVVDTVEAAGNYKYLIKIKADRALLVRTVESVTVTETEAPLVEFPTSSDDMAAIAGMVDMVLFGESSIDLKSSEQGFGRRIYVKDLEHEHNFIDNSEENYGGTSTINYIDENIHYLNDIRVIDNSRNDYRNTFRIKPISRFGSVVPKSVFVSELLDIFDTVNGLLLYSQHIFELSHDVDFKAVLRSADEKRKYYVQITTQTPFKRTRTQMLGQEEVVETQAGIFVAEVYQAGVVEKVETITVTMPGSETDYGVAENLEYSFENTGL